MVSRFSAAYKDLFEGFRKEGYADSKILRENILNSILFCGLIFGLPLIVMMFFRDHGEQYKHLTSAFVSTIVYLVVLLLVIFPKAIGFNLRAGIVLFASFSAALVGISKLGVLAFGWFTIQCMIVLTGVFIGYKFAMKMIPLLVMLLGGIAFCYSQGIFDYSFDVEQRSVAVSTWISLILGIGLFSFIVLICLGYIQHNLECSIADLKGHFELQKPRT